MDCCGCFRFAFGINPKKLGKLNVQTSNNTSRELLLDDDLDDEDDRSYIGDITDTGNRYDFELQSPMKRSEEIIRRRIQEGLICREFLVKETHRLVRSEDDDGNKMVNEYIRECKIGSGSYGKVILYRSSLDGKHYAIKAFHKSHLLKLRVAPCETAMTDVVREVFSVPSAVSCLRIVVIALC